MMAKCASLPLSRCASARPVWLRALRSDDLSVPSTATLVGSNLFAVNARFGVSSPDTAPYWVTRLKAV